LEIYSTGLSIIFLCTLDATAYSQEINCLLQSLKVRQKPHGGWGYPEKPTGDTSMTQYGVLSAWEATQSGFAIPQESIEAVTLWLLKTQDRGGRRSKGVVDNGGGFGYQGVVSETDGLVAQSDVKPSMSAAGLGSLFICADLLGLVPRAARRDENLPMALFELRAEKPKAADAKKLSDKISPRRVKDAEARGNGWMSAHNDAKRLKEGWVYYYLYAYERYASFRELAEGKSDPEPAWYTNDAQFLIHNQAADGSWSTKTPMAGKTADTAFAALFLLRSSKKSIEKAYGYGDSTMVAGRGLPKETGSLLVLRGKVLPAAQWTSAAELLPILQNREGEDFGKGVAALGQLPSKEADVLATQHADVLRRLIADQSPQIRIAAVQAIGNSTTLDLTPTLIYAMSDPDTDVACAACDALRRLSRTPGKGPIAGQLTDARRRDEIQYWKQWYQTIRPEAEFDN
jgi:hypothetical protein